MSDLAALLAPYAALSELECDGLTRVITTVLTVNGLPHTCYLGRVTVGGRHVEPHYWIELGTGLRVDYRARMWLGDAPAVPHGVFQPQAYPQAVYRGQPVTASMTLPAGLFCLLTGLPYPQKA